MSGIPPVWLTPRWPAAHSTVKALSSTRIGGHSAEPYQGLNLATHVADDSQAVLANRALLKQSAQLPAEPHWLHQVHGTAVHRVSKANSQDKPATADAAVCDEPGQVLAIMTADCLPVLFCATDRAVIGAAHAGWRGLAAGVLQATIAAMQCEPESIVAWLGPAIGAQQFEVGAQVREAFGELSPDSAMDFQPRQGSKDKYYADIYALARRQLAAAGVHRVHGGGFCTVQDKERFFSYRRDGVRSGRMASLIWLE